MKTADFQGLGPLNAVVRAPRDDWQWHLANAIRDVRDLGRALGLALEEVPTDFPLLVPRPYLARIEHGRRDDPLLRQVLPLAAENEAVPGYVADPLAEQPQATGALRKYRGRVLAVTTGACAINCRYCFRRHFPYSDRRLSRADWDALLDDIAADPATQELILSGGDPLVLPDRTLARILERAAGIPHLRSLRIHTRLPVVIPQRVTPRLVELLKAFPRPVTLVLHVNHPREVDSGVAEALAPLRGRVNLLNQGVLLAGVNDEVETLEALSWRLHEIGVMPYYLHLLDRVAGAAHFDTGEAKGRALIEALRGRLPGYLVPRLATEQPGAPSKTVLA